MTKNNQNKLGAHAVMFAVMKKKPEIVVLLVKNGIPASESETESELAQKVVGVLKASKTFRKDFLDLLSKQDVADACFSGYSIDGYSNAAGEPVKNPFSGLFDPALNTLPSGGTIQPDSTTSSTAETPTKSSWWNTTNIMNTLNTGLNAFLTLDKNKTDRELANAGVKIAQSNTGGSTGGYIGGFPQETKNNTTLYIVLGVLGVGLVGALIYLGTKRGK